MLTRKDMLDLIVRKERVTDSSAMDLVRRCLDNRYKLIWDASLWPDTLRLAATTATEATVTLPEDVDRVVAVRRGNESLEIKDAGWLMTAAPQAFDQSGEVLSFLDLGSSSEQTQVRLVPAPLGPVALEFLVKTKCPGLPTDSSKVELRGAADALMAHAHADLLEYLGKDPSTKRSEAAKLLEVLQDVEQNQGAKRQVLVPMADFDWNHRELEY